MSRPTEVQGNKFIVRPSEKEIKQGQAKAAAATQHEKLDYIILLLEDVVKRESH
jgi:hypothetical protein